MITVVVSMITMISMVSVVTMMSPIIVMSPITMITVVTMISMVSVVSMISMVSHVSMMSVEVRSVLFHLLLEFAAVFSNFSFFEVIGMSFLEFFPETGTVHAHEFHGFETSLTLSFRSLGNVTSHHAFA